MATRFRETPQEAYKTSTSWTQEDTCIVTGQKFSQTFPIQPTDVNPNWTAHSDTWGSITDVPSTGFNPRRRGKLGNKPCTHIKWNMSWTPIEGTFHRPSTSYFCPTHQMYHCTRERKFNGPWNPMGPFSGPTPPSWDSNDFKRRSFRQLTETMPRKVSVANFILELGDIKSLAKNATGIRDLLKDSFSRRSLNKIIRSQKTQRDAKKALKESASAHLALNFGILPFVEDVKALLSIEASIRKRISWLKKTSGKATSVRRRQVVPGPDQTLIYNNAGPSGVQSSWKRTTKFSNVRLVAVCGATSYQVFTKIDEAYRFLSFKARALGLDRPLSVVWEAIPFSFLVDYFIDVGEFMSGFSVLSTFDGAIGLRDPWYSTKLTAEVEVTYEYLPTGKKYTVAKGDFSSYGRSVKFSMGSGYPSVSGSLNQSQVENMLALLIQKGL